MANQVTGIQATVLCWARKSQGYTIEEVAAQLKRKPEEVEAWERGDSAPTYAQLETLAYRLYKRPMAAFFFPEPPVEPSLKKAFRTLPEEDLDSLTPDTRYQLRLARAFQLSLRSLNDGVNPAERRIFQDIRISPDKRELARAAVRVREYLGVSLEIQESWRNDEEALKSWRNAIEESGIFVFKQAFEEKAISGFCLLDEQFPVIYLNNSAAKTRQIFSLFHELAHLLTHVNGISKFDESYIDLLPQGQKQAERFCNSFAAEFLLPAADFDRHLAEAGHLTEQVVENLAKRYCVSREAVLRRLLDKQLVAKDKYEAKAREYAAQLTMPSGGDYYANQATYLSERYLRLVFKKHYQGQLSLEKVADFLGVKTKSVAGLENLVLRKTVRA